jgi:hypothetical protein
MNVRVHMMGHFEHEHVGAVVTSEHEHTAMPVDAAPATQGQFFLSYEM